LQAHGLTQLRVPKGLISLGNNFAPGLAAIVMIALTDGKAGLRELRRRLFQWRVGVGNYIFVLGVTGLCVAIALAIYHALGGALPKLDAWYTPLIYLLFFLLLAPLWEEICWRGYILPRLELRHSPLVASVLLALGWGLWHVPFYLGAGAQAEKPLLFLAWFLVGTFPLTILFTWVYNRTGGSLLLVVLFHSAIDATLGYSLNPLPSGELRPFIFTIAAFGIVAGVVISASGVELGRSPSKHSSE
jgi:hypothetical protein